MKDYLEEIPEETWEYVESWFQFNNNQKQTAMVIYTVTGEREGKHICFNSYKNYKDAEEAVKLMRKCDYEREGDYNWKYFINVSNLY